jgi:opacity protein-like surface antigen
MKTKFAGLTIAAAAMIAAAGPALAGGDVIYTGVKDPYAAAVPVPAPMPIPEYDAEYYVRFDTGAAWITDGDLSESGYGMSLRGADDLEPLEFFSIGAGKYLTPNIRAEIAGDLYTRGEVLKGQQDLTSIVNFDATTVGATGTDITTYAIERQESVKFEQDTVMLNFYYDFNNSSRFTPYVGAGIGATYRKMTRTVSEVAECQSLTNATDINRNCNNANDNPDFADAEDLTIEERTTEGRRWDVAGSLMAGVAVQITDDVLWDTGYRYMWQSGGVIVNSPAFNDSTSTMEFKDVAQHQLRTGIRLNLN